MDKYLKIRVCRPIDAGAGRLADCTRPQVDSLYLRLFHGRHGGLAALRPELLTSELIRAMGRND